MSVSYRRWLLEIALNEYSPVRINMTLAIIIRAFYNNNVIIIIIIIIIIITVIVIVTLLNFRIQSNIFDNIYTNVPRAIKIKVTNKEIIIFIKYRSFCSVRRVQC